MNDSIAITALLTVVLVIFVGSAMSDHYADALNEESTITTLPTTPIDTYEKSGFTLTHNPMICIFDPAPNSSFPILNVDLSRMARDAISDWSRSLHDPSHPTAWDIYFDDVSYDKVTKFNSTKCDIIISYLPSPTGPLDQKEPVGVTEYNFTNHKAKIIVYYLAITTDLHTKTLLNAYVVYWETITGFDQNHMASEGQISQVLRHELGHAFGLGHHISGDSSSVMDQTLIQKTRNYYNSVSQSDVQELQSLYGTNGFNSPIQPPPIPPVTQTPPQPIPPPIPPVIQPVPQPLPQSKSMDLIPTKIKYGARDWAMNKKGYSSFVNLLRWMSFENAIKLPQTTSDTNTSTFIPSWVKQNTKLWFQGDLTDDDFYTTLQYLIDKKIITVNLSIFADS